MEINKGDIYSIDNGKHYIICGSCLSQVYNQMLQKVKLEMVLTDPPYGIDILSGKKALGTSKKNYKVVHGDNNAVLFRKFYNDVILCNAITKLVVFGGNYFANILPSQKGWITWEKHNNDKISFNKTELIYTNITSKTDLIKYKWNGTSIEQEEKTYGIKRTHPTQKPIGLLKRLIEMANIEDGYILDGFGGSLSLLFAAEILNKKTIIFELDQGYVKNALETYSNMYKGNIEKIQLKMIGI